MDQLWALLGQVQQPATAQPMHSSGRRRSLRWPVSLASAALLLIALWLPQGAWLGWYADVATAPGEVRTLELGDGTILEHEVMRRDLGARIAQPGDGGLRALHAGVVQDQHVGPWDGRAVGPSAAALAVVRRGQDTPRHRAVGRHRRPRSAAIRS